MLAVIGLSEKVFLDHWKEPSDFFSIWRIASRDIHTQASEKQLQPLLASFWREFSGTGCHGCHLR